MRNAAERSFWTLPDHPPRSEVFYESIAITRSPSPMSAFGTKRTLICPAAMSAFGSKADIKHKPPNCFSHWRRSALAADIDGRRDDRPVGHFLSGEDDHLRAGLEVF
jgi:hypothetical protein